MNRVLKAVVEMQAALDRMDNVPQSVVKDASLTMAEYAALQEMKSLAAASGLITLEEAQTLYGYLGESLGTFERQSLAVRIVCVKCTLELITMNSAAMVVASVMPEKEPRRPLEPSLN